jgi:hypothetical protein
MIGQQEQNYYPPPSAYQGCMGLTQHPCNTFCLFGEGVPKQTKGVTGVLGKTHAPLIG